MRILVSVLVILLSSIFVAAYIPPPPLVSPMDLTTDSSFDTLNSSPEESPPAASQPETQPTETVEHTAVEQTFQPTHQALPVEESSPWLLIAIIALAIILLSAGGYILWHHYSYKDSLSAVPEPVAPTTPVSAPLASSFTPQPSLNDAKLAKAKLYAAQLRARKIPEATIMLQLRAAHWPEEYIEAAIR